MTQSFTPQLGFLIEVSVDFSAAHHIRGYDGDCARPHGHNYKITLEVAVPTVGPIGIAVDFKDIKKRLKRYTDRFDHQDLNTISPFDEINPTAETLAQYLFEELSTELRREAPSQTLRRVRVWENANLCASFGVL